MALTVGVDIGGTKIAAGVVDDAGEVLVLERRATPSHDPQAVAAEVVSLTGQFAQWCADHGHPAPVAVGLGTAGFIDAERSRVLLAPNLGWADVPLRDLVASGTGLPVVVENDANAAAWAEFRFGSGKDQPDLVCVTVGTGIGGGIVHEGRLMRGHYGMAAELGHVVKVPNGRLCGCGRRGCWEQYASGNALVREARELASERRGDAQRLLSLGDGTPEGVQGAHITEAARGGDPVAIEAFELVGTWLGIGLADLAAVLDPVGFVIGGGVSEAGELLLTPTRAAYLANQAGAGHRPPAEVVAASLGNEAGVVGAADLARTD